MVKKKHKETDEDWQYYYHGYLTAWQHTCRLDACSNNLFHYPQAYRVLDEAVSATSKEL